MPGPKGEERSSVLWWLLTFITCGLSAIYWIYKSANEMKEFTGLEEINPIVPTLLQLFFPPIGLAFFAYKMGGWMMQARQSVGLPAEDKSTNYALFTFILMLSIKNIQDDMNELWQAAGGGAPAQ
jgi:hypothetical protein